MESALVWPTQIMYLNNIMINQVKNILLLGLLAVFLTSCGSSVQEIKVTTVEVSKTPLNIPNPDPLQMNFADIRNYLAEQRQIIVSYKEYYESSDESSDEVEQ